MKREDAVSKVNMELEAELSAGLNPKQKEAVLHPEGPLLILAGAGSGKTRVITQRIAWLIRCRGVLPARILAITFTNKAARELKERLEQLIGGVQQGMWVGTFHGMMVRILRRHAQLLGYGSDFAILAVDEQLTLLRRLAKNMGLNDKALSEREVLAAISRAKNKLETPAELARRSTFNVFASQTAKLYEQYQISLKEQNAMDFDDLLVNAVRLFQQQPEVLKAYQEYFAHVLVDEYQDTNHCQYLLVKMLSAQHKNLCVVGDDDQSIYSFRGANLQNILDFEADFPNCKVIKLEQNYRSTGSILGAANAVIKQNTARKSKKLWTEQAGGEKLVFYKASDQFTEARYVAQEILRSKRSSKTALPYSAIAILYRVNALSRNLEFALRENGIPYRIYGGLRFFDRKEIKDVLAYLRLVEAPQDNAALLRIINTPRRGIGDVSLDLLGQLAEREQVSLFELMNNCAAYPELSRLAPKLRNFCQIINNLRQLRQDSSLDFKDYIAQVEEQSGLLAELMEQRVKGSEEAASRIENLRELLSDAAEFAQHMQAELEQLDDFALLRESLAAPTYELIVGELPAETLDLSALSQAFLERSSLYSDLDENEEEDCVSLMTVHSAKGLEFDLVFLVGGDDGIFPGFRAQDSLEDMEEERRLCYVAITRAKRKMHLLSARSRLLYGQTRVYPVSRFFKEIPNEFVQELGGSRGDEASPVGVGTQDGAAGVQSRHSSAPLAFKSGSTSGSGGGLNFQFGFASSRQQAQGEEGRPKSPPLDLDSLKPGQSLRHPIYGEAKLLRVDKVAGDAILSLQFPDKLRRMMLNSSKLERV